jgi:hypothetical protein
MKWFSALFLSSWHFMLVQCDQAPWIAQSTSMQYSVSVHVWPSMFGIIMVMTCYSNTGSMKIKAATKIGSCLPNQCLRKFCLKISIQLDKIHCSQHFAQDGQNFISEETTHRIIYCILRSLAAIRFCNGKDNLWTYCTNTDKWVLCIHKT